MRAREVDRLRRALTKVKVPRCALGWYRWGRYAVKPDGHRTVGSWVNQMPDGDTFLLWLKWTEIFEMLLKESLETTTGLRLHSYCVVGDPHVSIGVFRWGSGYHWLDPDSQVYGLAFGVYTGEVPHEMFHDALLHDTDILDEKPK